MHVYGFTHDDLEAATRAIESALSIQMQARDSSYIGDYSSGLVPAGPSVQVRRNLDPLFQPEKDPAHEKFAEPEYAAYPLLVLVDGTRPDSIADRLKQEVSGLSFLESRETM